MKLFNSLNLVLMAWTVESNFMPNQNFYAIHIHLHKIKQFKLQIAAVNVLCVIKELSLEQPIIRRRYKREYVEISK